MLLALVFGAAIEMLAASKSVPAKVCTGQDRLKNKIRNNQLGDQGSKRSNSRYCQSQATHFCRGVDESKIWQTMHEINKVNSLRACRM